MTTAAKKLYLIEKLLKVDNDTVLAELEKILNEAKIQLKKPNTPSSLRGKIKTKMSNEDIDKQLHTLREE